MPIVKVKLNTYMKGKHKKERIRHAKCKEK